MKKIKELKKMKKNNEGFTLVELIIVVAIIAMLIAMIAPNLTSFLDTSSETTLNANAKTSYTSVNAWLTQQRVKGVVVPAYSGNDALVITYDGDSDGLVIKSGSTDLTETYASLLELFNEGEIDENTTITIETTASYAVSSVSWDDGVGVGTYPN